ncbi:MAG: TetR/AcrR family transcriptional regulator [bacterium]|nr:TetR/AcrR family transcriptional regulator [bacterium]
MDTKEQLLEKAIQGFIEKGYENVSIDNITAECDITKGAFYYHFKNKDEIFIQAAFIIFSEINEWLNKKVMQSETTEEIVKSYFDLKDYFSYSLYYDNVNANIYTLLIDIVKRFPNLKKKIHEYFFANVPIIANKLEEAQKAGLVKKEINPNSQAYHIIYLVEGLLFISAITGDDESLIQKAENLGNEVWDSIKV